MVTGGAGLHYLTVFVTHVASLHGPQLKVAGKSLTTRVVTSCYVWARHGGLVTSEPAGDGRREEASELCIPKSHLRGNNIFFGPHPGGWDDWSVQRMI